jgi:hypothetical protein
MLSFIFLVIKGAQSLPPTVLPLALAWLMAYTPLRYMKENLHVDANLEKTTLSALLPNVVQINTEKSDHTSGIKIPVIVLITFF